MTNNVHNFQVRVYYEDTDVLGIVYYANYLKFFERARTEWLRELGIKQSIYLEQNTGFVVRRLGMENIASAKLDDLLNVTTTISEVKRASLVFNQKITNQTQQLLCTTKVRVAYVNLGLGKPCAMPKDILGALKRGS